MARATLSLNTTKRFAETDRTDAWWLTPTAVFLGLSLFGLYAMWAAFQGEHYSWGPYLSPLYSPEIFGESHHSLLGPKPSWWASWLPWSPAFLILWAPLGFRVTCYYYRGAYYKAFWADPPSCSVGEPRKGYRGERSFPLILQNVHRYFLYIALGFIVILSWDVWKALWFDNPSTGGADFGVGVGTLVLAANVFLLGSYTLGCHSLRHLVGGRLTKMSEKPVQNACYRGVCTLNSRHMMWAWFSLVWVGFTDFYVRMVAMGIWSDWRIL